MSREQLESFLDSLNPNDLGGFTEELEGMERRLGIAGPSTDDELWEWVRDELGLEIPRVGVCEGHVAPFSFFADAYFGRTKAAVVLASREGGKTQNLAALWLIMAKFMPGVEMLTAGAIEAQSKRLYTHVKNLLRVDPQDIDLKGHPDLLEAPMQSLTRFKNGSILEIIGGSVKALNGPHPNKFHFDEVDLAEPQAFEESRNISSSGNEFPKQDFITSTRKSKHGPMQKILDEVEESKRMGFEPAYDVYSWCALDCGQNVSNCREANPDLSEQEKCNCDQVVKGTWDDGSPRRFSEVCGGKLARAQGFTSLVDMHSTFLQNSRHTYEAQRLCLKPDIQGLVFSKFSRERHGVRKFIPDMGNGLIFQWIDWGGVNPSAVGWCQLLRYEIEVSSFVGKSRRLLAGTLVHFDEIYEPAGNIKLAELVLERERQWRERVPGFRVSKRFPDPQGAAARQDFARKGLPTHWSATRDIKTQIKWCDGLLDDDLFAVDVARCPWFLEEIDYYHYPPKKPGMVDDPEIPVDDLNHTMSGWRYMVANLHRLRGKGSIQGNTPSAGGESYAPIGGRKDIPVAVGGKRYSPRDMMGGTP